VGSKEGWSWGRRLGYGLGWGHIGVRIDYMS